MFDVIKPATGVIVDGPFRTYEGAAEAALYLLANGVPCMAVERINGGDYGTRFAAWAAAALKAAA
jgi:hypothetical protein